MSRTFDAEDDLLKSYVYVKMEKPAMEHSIMKEFTPIVIFGQKDYFKNKDLRKIYNFPLQQGQYFIFKDIVRSKESFFLFTFSESGRFS